MEKTFEVRQRTRRLQQVAARLGDLYRDIERLSLNVHRWQRQLDHIQDYVAARHHWIAQAQSQIDELTAQAEMLAAQYYSLNGEA